MDSRKRKARKFHCLLKQHPSHHQIQQGTFNHFYSLLRRQNPSRKWKIETDLYCKPTDKHQYLLDSSSHPYHTKKSIPYSLALRLRRICSKDDFFDTRSTELERYLTKRGYKNNFVKSQISRAKSIPRNDTLKENSPEIKKPDRAPLITTYNPALPNIHKVLRQKQPILHSTERLHEMFKETPVVAYRRSPNLRDLLVRAKLNPSTATQPNHSFGAFRLNSKHGCLTCLHIDNERTNYTFNNTGAVFRQWQNLQ